MDVYQVVTDRIIAALENGDTLPWKRPWTTTQFNESGLPENFATRKAYRGINTLMLWIAAMDHGFSDERWLTYKQAQELGLQVPRGAKGSPVVFFSKFDEKDKATGDLTGKAIPFLKTYTVFNIEQLVVAETGDGYQRPDEPDLTWSDHLEIEEMFERQGATVTHAGNRAFYSPSTDGITLPPKNRFPTVGAYYATKAHEFIHWTGGKKRLDRLDKVERENRPARAMEELIAEIGSAFVCAKFRIDPDGFQHESYVQSWLKCLHDDKRFVFQAAGMAQKAADYLIGTTFEEVALAA